MASDNHGGNFALVSPLYGSGTVVAWFLACCTVYLRFCLQTSKTDLSSIDGDLLAFVALPCVAVFHERHLSHDFGKILDAGNVDNATLEAMIFALDAPQIICTNFYHVVSYYVYVAQFGRSIRRPVVLFAVMIASLCIQISTGIRDTNLEYNRVENHKLEVDSPGLAFKIWWIGTIRGLKRKAFVFLVMLSAAPIATMTILLNPVQSIRITEPMVDERRYATLRPSLIPRSGFSIRDLDQVLALTGGLLVFGSTLLNLLMQKDQDLKGEGSSLLAAVSSLPWPKCMLRVTSQAVRRPQAWGQVLIDITTGIDLSIFRRRR